MPNINTSSPPITSVKELKLFGMDENDEVGWIFSNSLVPVADYAAGIEITQYNQLVRDENGEFWRVSGQVELPYVTTGAGIPEDDALVPVGDAVLRQDLADPDKGAAMVARGVVAADSIADLLALPEGQRKENLQYQIKEYSAGSTMGGGEAFWDAQSTEPEDGINVFASPAIHTGRWKRRKRSVDIADAGASPGPSGSSATTEAFLRAVAEGQRITYPYHPDGWFVEDTIQLVNAQEIHGPGRDFPGINASMAKPVVRFGNDANGNDRRNALRGVKLKNTAGDALYIFNSPDWSVTASRIEAFGAGSRAVYAQMSVRPYMANCRLGSSGVDSWCLQLTDNVNAGIFSGIQASGGQAGGVADVSRSYGLNFDSWVMESTKYGMRFGNNSDLALGGNCNAIRLTNPQWEQCEQPLMVGSYFTVSGFTMDGGFISNSSNSVIPVRDWAIFLGRVKSGYIRGTVINLHESEYLLNLCRRPGSDEVLSIQDFSVTNLAIHDIGAGLYKTSDLFLDNPTMLNYITRKRNLIDVSGFEPIGDLKSVIVGPLQTSTNTPSTDVITTGAFGGIVEAIEIVEASGELSGTLRIGSTVDATQQASVDLSAIAPVRGRVAVPVSSAVIRTDSEVSVNVTGTSGTDGTFKLRITYR